jgi:hypothetical protein
MPGFIDRFYVRDLSPHVSNGSYVRVGFNRPVAVCSVGLSRTSQFRRTAGCSNNRIALSNAAGLGAYSAASCAREDRRAPEIARGGAPRVARCEQKRVTQDLDNGGMRRIHLRGHTNILKRCWSLSGFSAFAAPPDSHHRTLGKRRSRPQDAVR